jgi:hypothetical protein
LIIIFFAILILVNALLFLSVGIDKKGYDNILPKTLFFWLTGVALLFSCYFLFSKIREINNKIVPPLVTFIVISEVILNFKYGGAFIKAGDFLSLFSEPIMWLLIATLIGHLILFIYKRNKPQMN